jgi:hypothetical protein
MLGIVESSSEKKVWEKGVGGGDSTALLLSFRRQLKGMGVSSGSCVWRVEATYLSEQ